MKEKIWTKKEVERYCKMILGYTPNIKFTSRREIDGFRAMGNMYTQTIELGVRKFPRILLWHECGHLIGHHPGSRHCHWTGEISAQTNALWRALDLGFIEIARELIEELSDWKVKNDVDYPRAAKIIKKRFVEHNEEKVKK